MVRAIITKNKNKLIISLYEIVRNDTNIDSGNDNDNSCKYDYLLEQ